MATTVNRRAFMNAAGVAAATGLIAPAAMAVEEHIAPADKVLIIGVSCSPRKGKTTATAVQAALDAAAAANPRIETKLVDLGGLTIGGWQGGAKPDAPGEMKDDFDLILPYFEAPNLRGLIIGSPSYFRSVSALCKAFMERLYVLWTPKMRLENVPLGAVAVGAFRNGGQELVIEQILTAMMCYEILPVGGKPNAHQGATLWNNYQDDITKDEFGMDTAKKLGIRIAETALKPA